MEFIEEIGEHTGARFHLHKIRRLKGASRTWGRKLAATTSVPAHAPKLTKCFVLQAKHQLLKPLLASAICQLMDPKRTTTKSRATMARASQKMRTLPSLLNRRLLHREATHPMQACLVLVSMHLGVWGNGVGLTRCLPCSPSRRDQSGG